MPDLRDLDAGKLALYLDDLFDPLPDDDPWTLELRAQRGEVLRQSTTWPLYEPTMRALHGPLRASPKAASEAEAALSKALAGADQLHDGRGGAIHYLAEALQRSPDVEDDIKATAAWIHAEVVPTLGGLQAPYEEEARQARARREKVEARADELRRITVVGQTAYDWIIGQIEAGEQLQRLLSRRSLHAAAAAAAQPEGPPVPVARLQLIGILNRARAALTDEMTLGRRIPSNAVELVFGFLDDLVAGRLRRKRGGGGGGGADGGTPPIDVPT